MFDAVEQAICFDELDEPPTSDPPGSPRWTFARSDHRESGSADDARRWLEQVELDSELHDAVADLIDDLGDTVTYVREDEARLDFHQTKNGVRFPDWLCELRRVVAWIEDDDGNLLYWDTGRLGSLDAHWHTANVGAKGDTQYRMLHQSQLLPIAQGMYNDLLLRSGQKSLHSAFAG